MKYFIYLLKNKFKFSIIELICLAIIIVVGSIILFRYEKEYNHGMEYRFDRLARSVEIKRTYGDVVQWERSDRFENLQQVRDYYTNLDRRRLREAIEEQTREISNARLQQQLTSSDIMKKYEDDKLRRDVNDIKDTIERQELERRMHRDY